VVYDLACALNNKGVDVTVACASESRLPDGVSQVNLGPAKYIVQQDWNSAERQAYDVYEGLLGEFDIIHDHSWIGWSYQARVANPLLKVLHTHHGHLAWRTLPPVPHLNFVGISQFMQNEYAKLGLPAKFVYNGIALEDYPFSHRRGERLIYLGRVRRIKQPHVAVGIARLTGVPLDIVGGDRFVDDPGYVSLVKDSCDGSMVRYLGEVPHALKLKYLEQSRAVVIPSAFGEPFGLVAVEALATGRPVVCLNDGALKEIVENGITGFVCESAAEMAETIKKGLDLELKAEDCRRRAEQFSREIMAEKYRELYTEILQGIEW
jgi:glycosyltransferase involved in cell wall biosynthesis